MDPQFQRFHLFLMLREVRHSARLVGQKGYLRMMPIFYWGLFSNTGPRHGVEMCKKSDFYTYGIFALLVASLSILSVGFPITDEPLPVYSLRPIEIDPETIEGAEMTGAQPLASYDRWWAGSVCNFFYYYAAKEVSFIMDVPSAVPSDWYAILLSTWDTNDSYDQIGFNSVEIAGQDYWYFCISRSIITQSGELLILTENYVERLTPGRTYKFRMKVYSGGRLQYQLSYKSGDLWFVQETVYRTTGAVHLHIKYNHGPVYGSWYYCFTDYEESETGSPAPSSDFKFRETSIDGVAFSTWYNLYANSPPGVTVSYGWDFWPTKPYVLIDNP